MSQSLEEIQQLSFMIILYAGNARSASMEAIQAAKNFDFEGARRKIEEAEAEFAKAHQEQTAMLQKEAAGESTPFSLILIHAQDHIMTSMTTKDLAVEMVEMYEKIAQLEG